MTRQVIALTFGFFAIAAITFASDATKQAVGNEWVVAIDFTGDQPKISSLPMPNGMEDDFRDVVPEESTDQPLDAARAMKVFARASELPFIKTRWFGSIGDTIFIIAMSNDGHKVTLEDPKEERRTSRFDRDLSTLKQIAKKLGVDLPGEKALFRVAAPSAQFWGRRYHLKETRAFVTINSEAIAEHSIKVAGAVKGTADATEKAELKLVTGPPENFFMTADCPVDSLKLLKYNKDDGSVALKKAPETYYLGLDYTFSDLASDADNFAPKNIVLKAMVKLSKRPQDSVGIGVGYRLPAFTLGGLNFKGISPFVGYFRTLEDRKRSDGSVDKLGGHSTDVRAGVSLDLSPALGWIGSAAASDAGK